MINILRGGIIEQLTFIPTEFRAALAVTNPSCKSNQAFRIYLEIASKLHPNINADVSPLLNILTMPTTYN